eukprot:GHRQ01006585.1.p2 GENE.GHRQ01006585.1~~GHRQ01006585.1.p2  ORF type:complete len:321 (+),score=147.63 GHRQ01006585.1:1207-2169(+)
MMQHLLVSERSGARQLRLCCRLGTACSCTHLQPTAHLLHAAPQVLFRCNGSAVLLTNRSCHAARAKYTIQHIVRTNLASDDTAYNCVVQTEDAERHVGVRLNKDLIKVGARALRDNMTALGPKVLPYSEQAKYAASLAVRKAAKLQPALAKHLPARWLQPYTPDFRKAFDYYCIHTGGRGIIDGLEKEMQLSRQQVEPSRASLYRFGNTSSTSVWYELAFIESQCGLAAGQKVWQLAFGSGFKFNSAVLVARRGIKDGSHAAWDGFDGEVMWKELDELEAAAAAGRAAKAAAAAAAGGGGAAGGGVAAAGGHGADTPRTS